MEISRSTAMRIVTELSEIISQKVNLMDEKGMIIASTDPERIGTLHVGSQEVLEKKISALVIHNDDEYPGSKAGLNLPIEMDGRYIGVVGITGRYESIEKYGRIIKKMTEILLLDDYLKEQKHLVKSVRSRYIQEWIPDLDETNISSFASRGIALGIDITIPRRVMTFTPVPELEATLESQQLLNQAERTFQNILKEIPGCLMVLNGKQLLCLVPDRTDRELLRLANELSGAVKQLCGLHMAVGMDSQPVFNESLAEGCLRAEKALRSSILTVEHPPIFYKDINLEIFIRDIPIKLKQEYIEKVFQNCTQAERGAYMRILKVLYACNGSIQQTAQQLFLHKNTLQYKLNKLYTLTGINPRTAEGTALYYLAIAFNETLD